MAAPDDPLLDDALAPGVRLGPWTIDASLGSGGNATVWRAHHRDGRVVALKVLSMAGARPEDLARFERERRALEALDHPHVVAVRDGGRAGRWAWIALDLVEGVDLQARIAQWATTPEASREAEVRRVFRELTEALSHIHEHGLVHRDVKPANVLLDAEGRVRLTDFGVVTTADVSRITMAGSLVGTIAYMAPELIAEEPFDARADLYGLGGVLYAMLTLRKPIEADSVAGYLAHHLTRAPTPPHELADDVPDDLERICLRLLEKVPERRYASARAVLDVLDGTSVERVALHGRDEIVAHWREALEAQRAGMGDTLLVQGVRGSGRSALLAHLGHVAEQAGLTVGTPTTADGADVVLVDDADGLAPADREAVRTARARQALVVLARHPDAPGVDAATTITLRPLGRAAVSRVLRDHGVPPPAASALATRLAQTPSAQPGPLLELLDALEREGWLRRTAEGYAADRPASSFQVDDLPAPASVRQDLLARFTHLPPTAQELAQLLALLGRPAGAALLAKAADRPAKVPPALDHLVRKGWLRAEPTSGDHRLHFTHPCAARVLRQTADEERASALHLALANALGARRRRRASAEAARHLAAAGHPVQALPMLIRAAQRALKAGDALTALSAAEDAARLDVSEPGLPRGDIDRLRGAALLALGRWPEAMPLLEAALEEAILADDGPRIAVAASDVGRTRYRLGRHDAASAALELGLARGDEGTPGRAPARRALADIHLQRGELGAAMALLRDALDDARAPHEEARARRGIAHVLGLEQRYGEAARELELADDLLTDGGDPRVRAGILVRAIELDVVGGRWNFARQRQQQLLDLVEVHGLGARLPEALAQGAVLDLTIGRDEPARATARRAVLLARPHAADAWAGLLPALRVLAATGHVEPDDVDALDAQADLAPGVRDPQGQALAVRARVLAATAPDAARDAAADAMARPPARWGLAQVVRLLDLGAAFVTLGDDAMCLQVLDGAERWIDLDRSLGARWLLDLRRMLAGDVGARVRATHHARALAEGLPPRLRRPFLARPAVASLLSSDGSPPLG